MTARLARPRIYRTGDQVVIAVPLTPTMTAIRHLSVEEARRLHTRLGLALEAKEDAAA